MVSTNRSTVKTDLADLWINKKQSNIKNFVGYTQSLYKIILTFLITRNELYARRSVHWTEEDEFGATAWMGSHWTKTEEVVQISTSVPLKMEDVPSYVTTTTAHTPAVAPSQDTAWSRMGFRVLKHLSLYLLSHVTSIMANVLRYCRIIERLFSYHT